MDGSFDLYSELDRFLARCPKLRHVARFSSLLNKGHELMEAEAVDSLASVFLHPDYTIPMMGCFRPMGRKIVDKVIGWLSLVPNLGVNSGEECEGDEVFLKCEEIEGIEDVGVIEFYLRRGRGLDLHELACFAFCRVLDLAPHLKGSVEYYYNISAPPFIRIRNITSNSKLSAKVISHLVFISWVTYRSLLMDVEFLAGHWNWSCFLDLLQQLETPSVGGIEVTDITDVRWCVVQLLLILLKLPRIAANFVLRRAKESLECKLRWQKFCCDTTIEKAGWYLPLEKNLIADGFSQQDASMTISSELLMVEPLRRDGQHAILDGDRKCDPFVVTSAIKGSAERVALAVNQKWPVLLYGPAGSGKTALIDKLAVDSGNRVLSLHMDEQIDGRTLLGSYVCTEQPGEFRWQPGSLTQAVMNGLWVVFENINQAPADVQSTILPLLEGASSLVTGNGEVIRADQGFRIFSTVTSWKLDGSRNIEGRNFLSSLWRRVMLWPPSMEDLVDIIGAWYPDLVPIAETLTATLESVNKIYSGSFGVDFPNRFSTRDLLKWCKRISGSGFVLGNELSSSTLNAIFLEAADIFLASSASARTQRIWLEHIGKMWGVQEFGWENLWSLNKPLLMESSKEIQIGRACLQRSEAAGHHENKPFVKTRSSMCVLERIACSVKWNEPVLLVGETGTGKTTLVQSLASKLGHKLTVLNLSQQSDVTDLLGGFKPTDLHSTCTPLYEEFEGLFFKTFPKKGNEKYLSALKVLYGNRNWVKLLRRFDKVVNMVIEIRKNRKYPGSESRKTPLPKHISTAWEDFEKKLQIVYRQITASSGMLFSFVEGAFVTALRNGDWILLDEVNLAPPETLQRIIGVLDGQNRSLCLAERGDVDYLYRHSDFRVFACMNPATDAGKRDLPYSLRCRFTEYFVDDVLDDDDLTLFVSQFIGDNPFNKDLVSSIVTFYKAAKKESEERLQDGANQKPQYSLRSLYRALEYTKEARRRFTFEEALYDGFGMFFKTLLDGPSAKVMDRMIMHLLSGDKRPVLQLKDYLATRDFGNYVLTGSVQEHLKSLAKATTIGRYPVLLQGPTSSGKTSLVKYLAAITDHKCVRINNHEHTDLQEYLGSYVTDSSGKLVFQEGLLVNAVRHGHWIVLDELNLAPSDVLEALNRLLDDNRELFVPELRETIRAHPDFMLFATQNPPTVYGGRKMLSRAFRNRFVEIHVEEIPEGEWSTILSNRCKVPESYAKKMVEVMKELQLYRQSSKVFAGKHGFITPRDLFRWADRFRADGISYDDLARDGYLLLAERLREEQEKDHVQEILKRHLHVKKLVDDGLYKQAPSGLPKSLKPSENCADPGNIVWTKSMWRLYYLVQRCYSMREPVLLVGETGGGKTTVCQLLSKMLGSKLHILNCHQYTETSDFIGGFFPIRERSRITSDYNNLIEQISSSTAFIHARVDATISCDINQASLTLKKLEGIVNSHKQNMGPGSGVSEQDLVSFEHMRDCLCQLHQKWQTIFMWQDGPLVQAMKNGDLFLVDEISLADDSVLERLNSVLEPERELLLAERGVSDTEKITAHPNFFLLATMNPGGDYGKKELSPALRNRFTEIWVPPVTDLDELRSIAIERFSSSDLHYLVDPIISFWKWFNAKEHAGRTLTVRDLLSWVAFIDVMEKSLEPGLAFLHGAFLVLLDGLSLGTGLTKYEAGQLRDECLTFLLGTLKDRSTMHGPELSLIENFGWGKVNPKEGNLGSSDMQCDNIFGIHPFYIEKGHDCVEVGGYEFLAPTTRKNVLRLLRAMQLAKPVLLEGSPGVGKTSLIIALGKFSGHKVVRINLSEQTDIMDLLGSDLPVESEQGIQFAWSDGILLQALKEGSWVLLDELNLAPQSVLEGLNSILDHRAEVFIPELGLSFKCPQSFRVFACQNPSHQGGGRKGLPKSFLNRFTKVYVDELVEDDYRYICSSLFPEISGPMLEKMISFNKRLYEETMLYRKFAQEGSPWEFNLRDVIRSCEIIRGSPGKSKYASILNVVYVQRMRTAEDRRKVIQLFEETFGFKPSVNPYPRVQLNDQVLLVGNACVKRNHFLSSKSLSSGLKVLPAIRNNLEAAAQCVQQGWLCILVGPTSSGKTSLVRLLAQLSGNVLHEINLSPATDISELIGYFEQYNAFRNFQSVVSQVEVYVNTFCNQKLVTSPNVFLRERMDLVAEWLSSLPNITFGEMSRSGSDDTEKWSACLSLLLKIIELLRPEVEGGVLHGSISRQDLERTSQGIQKLQEVKYGGPISVKFEWASGLLINAIEKGEWVVLEDANLCNPTILDRINSLAESNGSITINECGNVEGKPLVVHPHPEFRLFLTVNPTYGEVSRAMRNRGVEIVMMQPNWLLDEEKSFRSQEIELNDIKRFLILSNIPTDALVDCMAKSHLYAIKEGVHLHVCITYLELSRWIQLLQQLLMSGNGLMWSLRRSWEYTYLSSLGESEGLSIVSRVKSSFLSENSLLHLEQSHCLPGGWPAPLQLRDFVQYPKEACVRQSCISLEYLGSQYALCELHKSRNQDLNMHLSTDACNKIYLMHTRMLEGLMYPKSAGSVAEISGRMELDSAFSAKALLFSANWAVEQATEDDLEVYLRWFDWFDSQLQPYCHVFSSFVQLLGKELNHPTWNNIRRLRKEIISGLSGQCMQFLPMLSLEFDDLLESRGVSSASSRLLSNAISSVSLLRRSLWQWNAETVYVYDDHSQQFKPVLKSLRKIEKEVLKVIVESPSFDTMIQAYANLLEEHISFWKSIISSSYDFGVIHWRFLVKYAQKLQELCPQEVESFLVKGQSLHNGSWCFSSAKSLLWTYGGHPFLPFSRDLYYKFQQLFCFFKQLWPKKWTLYQEADSFLVEIAASSNPELRLLAMQGVCLISHVLGKYEDKHLVDAQLEEIFQMLLKRFEHEKHKLVGGKVSEANLVVHTFSASCCSFSPELLCNPSGFAGWMETAPIVDQSIVFLDFLLLNELSKLTVANDSELRSALFKWYDDLRYSMHISLNLSSRSPLDLLPQQKLLWILEAWESANAVNVKIASSILEMWFRWHSFLWNSSIVINESSRRDETYKLLPDALFTPVKTLTLHHMLASTFSVQDIPAHRHKLRVASCNLWLSVKPGRDLYYSFLSAIRSLLHQIISAHRKSFSPDQYDAVMSFNKSFSENTVKDFDVQGLVSLLVESKHQAFTSVMDSFMKPLLKEVYLPCSLSVSPYNLGCAWIRLGGMRFQLLLSNNEVDPAVKYTTKCLQLEEMIMSLELEIKVRQECTYLTGSLTTGRADDKRFKMLDELQVEMKRVQRKIVFRPDHGKFKKLKYECDEFLNLVHSCLSLMEHCEHIKQSEFISQAGNWQATANSFIERLSEEYSAYEDIIQPIQVAVYEMKLGLSLVAVSSQEKDYLERIEESSIDLIQEAIYSFMRFPVQNISKASVEVNFLHAEDPFYTVKFPSSISGGNLPLLEKLITLNRGVNSSEKFSPLGSKASLFNSVLARVISFVCATCLLDDAKFSLMHEIFEQLASIWMGKKVLARIKTDTDTQDFKFKPRTFEMGKIYEVDLSSLSDVFAGDCFHEWKELIHEEDSADTAIPEDDNSKEWNLIEEPVLINIIRIHNLMFGSDDLYGTLGVVRISDTDKLLSFTESYALGAKLVKGLLGIRSSFLDCELGPEHLLRLSLEHQRKLPMSGHSTHMYNFYKDTNISAVAGMVKLLFRLQGHVISLLKERDEHAGLQKILEIIKMLLTLPSTIPLAKALSGVQFLCGRVKMMQEDGCKFPLNDELEPISTLASSWQKMEFDSWRTMLDEVLAQFEINASKLWFPLYSLLHQNTSTDIFEYRQTTIESLEEFIQTSNVGEFRKRLQLILAFLGQVSTGISLGLYTDSFKLECKKILYNVFGFYIQCLPIIMEHLEASRRQIERELQDLLKLCGWERTEKLISIENSKKNRLKLKKLIQKYTEALQQPVILVLNQEISRKVHPGNFGDLSEKHQKLLHAACDLPPFGGVDRNIWCENWQKEVNLVLQDLVRERAHKSRARHRFSNGTDVLRKCSVSYSVGPSYQDEWQLVWDTLGRICRTADESVQIWKEEKKTLVKKRALRDLLKLLESSGLSRLKSRHMEERPEDLQTTWWSLRPSYVVEHLLPRWDVSSRGKTDTVVASHCPSLTGQILDDEWKAANTYYFKSLASLQRLQEICLNMHKDFRDPSDHVQVEKARSYVDHLIVIQQEQRDSAYTFADRVKHLRECIFTLSGEHDIPSSSTEETVHELSQTQENMLTCMWNQKELFDALCALSQEEVLLLRTVESSHLNTCQNVKAAIGQMLDLVEKFSPSFKKSKAMLDFYVLGDSRHAIKIATELRPILISKDMEQSVIQNFQIMREFRDDLIAFRGNQMSRSSVEDTLLHHFEAIIEKGEALEKAFCSCANLSIDLPILPRKRKSSVMSNESMVDPVEIIPESESESESRFSSSLGNLYERICSAFQKLISVRHAPSVVSLEDMTSWKTFFDTFVADLQLDNICSEFFYFVSHAVKLASNHRICSKSSVEVKHLRQLLDLLLAFSDGLLRDFVAVHKMVAFMTHTLAEVFALLFSKGYGGPEEEQGDEDGDGATKDSSGTGMGEGAGVKDVSDEITDEDQLLGTSEKKEEDALDKAPSDNDKGIEMQQDFEADAFSVSEDSVEDDDNENADKEDEDDQLDSAMGNAGADSEVVDEKLWDKEDERNPDGKKEKFESGPAVKDRDSSGRELRAKEDTDAMTDEKEEGNLDIADETDGLDASDDGTDAPEDLEAMNVDKEETVADPTGLDLDEPDNLPGNTDMVVAPSEEHDDEANGDEDDENTNGDVADEEKPSVADETLGENAEPEQAGETVEKDNFGEDDEKNDMSDLTAPRKDDTGQGFNDFMKDHLANSGTVPQPSASLQVANRRNVAQEEKWSNESGIQNDLAPLNGVDQREMMLDNPSKGEKVSETQSVPQGSQQELSFEKNQPNPLRNIGDALEAWKEKVKVSIDIQDENRETVDEMVGEDADEYGFTSNLEKGTAQALGSAMPDQIQQSINGEKADGDVAQHKENNDEMQHQNQDMEIDPIVKHAAIRNKFEEQVQLPNFEKMSDDIVDAEHDDLDPGHENSVGSFASLKRSYISEDVDQLSKLSIDDEEMGGEAHNLTDAPNDATDSARALWRKYEMRTVRLSQELSEQLRLVMEPTLASKLQGDYRTGKRINMKKVIPYIASHYRKDKIWLRRTKPNKRDYQVVIAVDDSRSMSESHCVDVAINALVTVCRAMSQLEVGKLAVASFGKKGNVKLLHGFDQPFTGEAGIKMISSLTFQQENMITDEPMVDMLTYLNNMLDQAAANARLPSGQNPLEQLVLIIADGRFHEKGKLKRYVREMLNKKRMVAFLLLDSPQESIMDLMDASFRGGSMQFSKYMDSFPFPYYVVLRDIEALPRTLADLLRQWFELMQSSRG
ncbi:hypothetical protein Drorol1_Dr00013440 [Drosera rotundifolia]